MEFVTVFRRILRKEAEYRATQTSERQIENAESGSDSEPDATGASGADEQVGLLSLLTTASSASSGSGAVTTNTRCLTQVKKIMRFVTFPELIEIAAPVISKLEASCGMIVAMLVPVDYQKMVLRPKKANYAAYFLARNCFVVYISVQWDLNIKFRKTVGGRVFEWYFDIVSDHMKKNGMYYVAPLFFL